MPKNIMHRFFALLACVNTLWLTGCLRTTETQQAPIWEMAPTHTEKYRSRIKSLAYSPSGETLLAAGNCCVNLYKSIGHNKIATLNEEYINDLYTQSKPYEFSTAHFTGAAYIDENIWYFSTGDAGANIMVDIQQIKPAQSMFKYDLGDYSERPIVANKNHLAIGGMLLNWRNGRKHEIKTHLGGFGYKLTENSQVITHNPIKSHHVLVHDPVKQESQWLDTGSFVLNTAINADGTHMVTISNKGQCVLWQLPEQKKLGNCGRAGLLNTVDTFQPDGRLFRVITKNELREYQTQPFKHLRSIPLQSNMTKQDWVANYALNDRWLAAIDGKGKLRVWSLPDGRLRGAYRNETITETDIQLTKLAFQPGGTYLAVSQAEWLMVFDLADIPEFPHLTGAPP